MVARYEVAVKSDRMFLYMNSDESFELLTRTLAAGGIAVVRTDTLYGIIALASDEKAVAKVYEAKHRSLDKACIVLLADASQAAGYQEMIATNTDPEHPTSVVVPVTSEPDWIHRGGKSVAYRVVSEPFLQRVIAEVGPVIGPSANPEGLKPASTIEEARIYFGKTVGVYIDGGTVSDDVLASRIIEVYKDGSEKIIRA